MFRLLRAATCWSVLKGSAGFRGRISSTFVTPASFSMMPAGGENNGDRSAGSQGEPLIKHIETVITGSNTNTIGEGIPREISNKMKSSAGTTTLRYISDIHLEFYDVTGLLAMMNNIKRINPFDKPEVLVLAGDIGKAFSRSYSQFLADMNNKFDKVFVIPGNHEYYERGYTIKESLEQMESVVKPLKNVTFLHRKIEFYNGYYFVGATQWGDLTNTETNKYKINHIGFIKDMSVEKFQSLYNEDKHFIETTLDQIAEQNNSNNNDDNNMNGSTDITKGAETSQNCVILKKQNVVMITHHLPSYELTHSFYRKLPFVHYSGWFSGSLDNVLKKHENMIKFWIYGHTHEPSTQMLNFPSKSSGAVGNVNLSGVDLSLADIEPKCVYLCNPLGYPGEQRQGGDMLDYLDAYVDL